MKEGNEELFSSFETFFQDERHIQPSTELQSRSLAKSGSRVGHLILEYTRLTADERNGCTYAHVLCVKGSAFCGGELNLFKGKGRLNAMARTHGVLWLAESHDQSTHLWLAS